VEAPIHPFEFVFSAKARASWPCSATANCAVSPSRHHPNPRRSGRPFSSFRVGANAMTVLLVFLIQVARVGRVLILSLSVSSRRLSSSPIWDPGRLREMIYSSVPFPILLSRSSFLLSRSSLLALLPAKFVVMT
jgi:hypothetical protein